MRGARLTALVLALLAAPAHAQDEDRYIPERIDISGTWINGGPGVERVQGQCYDTGVPRCSGITNRRVMEGRDLLTLRATDVVVAAQRIEIQYEGVLQHHLGFLNLRSRGMFMGYDYSLCGVEGYLFEGTGTLVYDIRQGQVRFTWSGDHDGTTEPIPTHTSGVRLETTQPFSMLDPGGAYALFPTPEGNWINVNIFAGSDDATLGSCRSPLPNPGIRMSGGRTVVDTDPLGFRRYDLAPELVEDLVVTVVSSVDGIDISRGRVILLAQDGYLRARAADETDAEYEAYVAEHTTAIRAADLGGSEQTVFEHVPVLRDDGRGFAQRARYTVRVLDAEADVDEAIFGTPLFIFQPASLTNATVTSEPELRLQPLEEIGRKRSLVERLSALSPTHYRFVEEPLVPYLDGLSAPTPAQVEGLRRGIWAERVTLETADYARTTANLGLENLGGLLGNLIDDFAEFDSKAVRESSALRDRLADPPELSMTVRDRFNLEAADLAGAFRNTSDASIHLAQRAALFKLAVGMGKTMSKVFFNTLTALDVEAMEARRWSDGLGDIFKLAFGYLVSQTGPGAFKGHIQSAVESIPPLFGPLLFDGVLASHPVIGDVVIRDFPSFTEQTEGHLEYSATHTTSWATDDLDAYVADSTLAARIHTEMVEDATQTIANTIWNKALTDTFDAVGTVAEVASVLIKWFEIVEKFAKFLKYASNGAAILDPFVFFFADAPSYVDRGVHAAWGEPLEEDRDPLDGDLPPIGEPADLSDDLAATFQAARDSFDVVFSALGDDDIGAALAGNGAMHAALEELDERVDDLELAGQAAFSNNVAPPAYINFVTSLQRERLAFLTLWGAYHWQAADLFAGILTGEIEPDSAAYMQARGGIFTRIRELIDGLDSLRERATLVDEQVVADDDGPPAIGVHVLALEDADGAAAVTATGQVFTLRARVRSVFGAAARGVRATLVVHGPDGVASVVGAADRDLGTVAAGSEQELEWQVRWDGPLQPTNVNLQVVLSEGGDPPTSFHVGELIVPLLVSPAVYDADGDAMPDAWERAHGLDPEVWDAGEDGDGDGAPNLVEYREELDASDPDTDGDGVGDGEELYPGDDGLVSDPRVADTDGDGVDDGDDGAPTDAGATAGGALLGEPEVAVNVTEVELTEEIPRAFVLVSNAGEGSLRVSVQPEDAALLRVAGGLGTTRREGLIEIGVPDDYAWNRVALAETTLHITDVVGMPDRQTVRVLVRGDAPPEPMCFCSDICATAMDGRCTDGLNGTPMHCAMGTDCTDCGPRGDGCPEEDAGTGGDGGGVRDAGPGGGPPPGGGGGGGCGCRVSPAPDGGLVALLALGWLLMRRWRSQAGA